MMRSEFEKISGLSVTADEYKIIEAEYNESDLDKSDFIAEFLKGSGFKKLADDRLKKIYELLDEITIADKSVKRMKEKMDNLKAEAEGRKKLLNKVEDDLETLQSKHIKALNNNATLKRALKIFIEEG